MSKPEKDFKLIDFAVEEDSIIILLKSNAKIMIGRATINLDELKLSKY